MADKQVNIIVRAVDAVTGELRKIGDGVDSFATTIKGVFAGVAAAIAALGIGKLFKDSIEGALEAEKSAARLDAALKPLGSSYRSVKADVEAYLDNIQRTTRYSDEEAREALTKLVIATGSLGAAMKDMPAVINLAAAANVNLTTAADMVTKAHMGVGRELKNFGIEVKAGTDAVPQLTAKLGDFEASSRTMGDRLGTVNNLWNEFKERLGAALLGGQEFGGGMDRLIDILVRAANWIDQNSESIGRFADFVIRFVGDAGSTLGGFFSSMADSFSSFKEFNERMVTNIQLGFGQVIVGFADMVNTIGGPILRLFGIEVVDGLKEKGQEMVNNAQAHLANMAVAHVEGYKNISLVAKAGEDDKSNLLNQGGQNRLALTSQELKAREKAETDYQKALEAAEKASFAVRKDAMSEAYAAFLTASQGLWDQLADLQKKALAAGETQSDEYVKHIKDIQEALGIVTEKWAKAELAARGVSNGMDLQSAATESLRAHTQDLNVNLDDLLGATEAQQVADINAAKAADDHAKALEAIKKAIGDSADKLRDFGGALRGMSPDMDQFADVLDGIASGFEGIATGIATIASGDVFGGITPIIGGVTSLIGMFTGESESSRRVRMALEDNRAALERNTSALGDLGQTNIPGGDVAAIAAALASFLQGVNMQPGQIYLTPAQEADLVNALQFSGVSLGQLESLAADYNFTLRPQGPGTRLDVDMLRQFVDFIRQLDTALPQDFRSQLQRLQDLARVPGVAANPVQWLMGNVLDLAMSSSPFLASAWAGSSIGEIGQSIPGIMLNRGSVGQMGLGRMSLNDFDEVLTLLTDLISQLPDSILGIVPGDPSTIPTMPNVPAPSVPGVPTIPGMPGSSSLSMPAGGGGGAASAPVVVNNTIGDINVTVAQTNATATDIANATASAVDQVLAQSLTQTAATQGNVAIK